MTNKDFIELVVRDKKIPYDNNLLEGLLYQYFKNAIELLEKQIDFNYMEKTLLFTVLAGQHEINLNNNVKKVKTLIDKTHGFELIGDDDISVFYLMFQDNASIPKKFIVSNNTVLLPCPLKDNTDYVIRYYVFTYRDTDYIALDTTHPLIDENNQLLLSTVGTLIDRYYSPQSMDANLTSLLENIEKNTQMQKRKIVTTLKIDYGRY